jgi:hypothetical protein
MSEMKASARARWGEPTTVCLTVIPRLRTCKLLLMALNMADP